MISACWLRLRLFIINGSILASIQQSRDNNVLIRSGEARLVGWSRIMLYLGFNTLHRSVVRRQTGFAARITRTLCHRRNGHLDETNELRSNGRAADAC